jgi:hypothetical protein
MTMLTGQEKLPISGPLARLEGERRNPATNSLNGEIAGGIVVRFGRTTLTTEKAMLGEDTAVGP